MRKDYSHEIMVDRPIEEAFALFTPKGEEAWVPGWKPTYIDPDSGDTRKEMLFTTGEGEETTYWTCLTWQPDTWHVRYLRLTPASRVSFVDVQCQPDGPGRTRVQVGYEMRALTRAGQAYISDLSDSGFADMINEWPVLIEAMADLS
ncbi:MAG: SRPBCC family protein [Alphaproteobacteria bacterium]|nr:SRPBCC family protein [Alphaproteobacteria bacterium]